MNEKKHSHTGWEIEDKNKNKKNICKLFYIKERKIKKNIHKFIKYCKLFQIYI